MPPTECGAERMPRKMGGSLRAPPLFRDDFTGAAEAPPTDFRAPFPGARHRFATHSKGRTTMAISRINPFLPAFDLAPIAPAAEAPSKPTKTGYAMVASAPKMDATEVEEAHIAALEVTVRWGDNVLCTKHLSPPRAFVLGDANDYLVPEEILGAARLPVVAVLGNDVRLVVPGRATGTVTEGDRTDSLENALATRGSASHAVAGSRELPLATGTTGTFALPGTELTISVTATCAGKKPRAAFWSGIAAGAVAMIGVSLALHAAVIGSFAYFVPNMGADSAEGIDRDQVQALQKSLNAQAERERQKAEEEKQEKEADNGMASAAGERAKGSEGMMGKTDAASTGKHWAKAGPQDNPNPQLSRAEALADARNAGIIGLLNSGMLADPSAPTAEWAPLDGQGRDSMSFMGNMFGPEAGDSLGVGGLGLNGLEQGGGGNGEGVGLSDHGGIGGGLIGTCTTPGGCHGLNGDGTGHSRDRVPGNHKPTFSMRPAPTTVSGGRIPMDVIQRIVRQNNGRFRACYEAGLRNNPALSGRIATKFVIDRSGAVSLTSDAGSDLADKTVVSCVVRNFANLSFPAPEGGSVMVTYPITFSPE
jgi:hypothetical protein